MTIKTLTGELEEKFPLFRFTDYSVMDDGSIIVQNEGGKIGIRNNDGKWELIPEHDKKYPVNTQEIKLKDVHMYNLYLRFVI